MRPCIEHGCPEYVERGSRCRKHLRAFEAQRWARGSTGRRGTSREWFYARRSRLVLDGERCRFCGTPRLLEVHHADANPRHNDLFSLLTLCDGCHGTLHRNMNYTKTMANRPLDSDGNAPHRDQLTLDECIELAIQEDAVRLARDPALTLRQVVAERLARQEVKP